LTFAFPTCIEMAMFDDLKERTPAIAEKLEALRRHL
jgi:hypothetical protein